MTRRPSGKDPAAPPLSDPPVPLTPWQEGIAAGSTALVVGVVASVCRAPGVLFADAGELLVAAAAKGVAHPPGFPLYLLLSGLWLDATSFVRLSAASRLNLFSSVCVGIAAGLVVWTTLRLLSRVRADLGRVERLALAVLAGLLAGFGRTLFDFSLGVEVYALHAVLLALAMGLALAAGAHDSPSLRLRLTIACGVAVGLGLAVHHATMVVILPGLAVLLWGREEMKARRRRIVLFSAAFAPGLLLYGLLPLRAAARPALNWGDPVTARRLWEHLSAHIYQVNIESSTTVIAEHAARFLEAFREEVSLPGILLALLGAAVLLKRGHLATAGLLLVMAGDIAFAVRYEIAEDQAAYYIPTFLATALLIAAGAAAAIEGVRRKSPALARVVLAAVLLMGLALTSRHVVTRKRLADGRAPEAAANFLAALPQGALCLTPEWNLYAPVLASRIVEGERPDALVLDTLLLRRGWYLDTLAQRSPERVAELGPAFDTYRKKLASWEEGRPFDANELTGLYHGLTKELVKAAWTRGAPVVWIGTLRTEHLPVGSTLVPSGIGYVVLPNQEAAADYIQPAPIFLRSASRAGLPRDDVFEEKVRPLYVGMLLQRTFYELAHRKLDEAESFTDQALALNPTSAEACEVKAEFLVEKGRLDEALSMFAAASQHGADAARIAEKIKRAQSLKAAPPPAATPTSATPPAATPPSTGPSGPSD